MRDIYLVSRTPIAVGVFLFMWGQHGFWWGLLYGFFWEVWIGYRLAQWLGP